MTIAEFLAARLDEDEAMAKAAGGFRWRASLADILVDSDDPHWNGACSANAAGEDGAHIARHDPARVLREVTAKRAILTRYEDCLIRMEDPGHSAIEAARQACEYEDFVLPAMADVYDGHPGYRPEWKP